MIFEEHTAASGIGEDIRWIFVSFLFAVVASEIASKFSKLALNWRSLHEKKVPTLTHLLLASVIVVTSWIGWSIGTMKGYYVPVTEVFSLPTIALVLDIVILTLYYILVAGVEIPNADSKSPDNSAEHVTYWSMAILITYLVFDLATYVVIPYPNGHFGQSACISLIAACAGALVHFSVTRGRGHSHNVVALIDISLICIFLSYRTAKQSVIMNFPDEAKHLPPPTSPVRSTLGEFVWIFFILSIVSAFAALLWHRRNLVRGRKLSLLRD